MKNFTQKFTAIFALVFTISFTVNAQQIGDIYEGGYIFQINEDGTGLVASIEDLTEGATNPYAIGLGFNGYEWGCLYENVEGADGIFIGTGYQNTMDIVNQGCITQNGGITAVQAALDAEINDYSDWYLPSKDELNEMYNTIGNGGSQGNIGGFETSNWPWYWSSSEYNNNYAWSVNFGDGNTDYGWKNGTCRVRVIRSVTFGEEENTEDETTTLDDTADNYLDLPEGWSMFGYTCPDSVDAMVGFSEISDYIEIVKDEWGLSYIPSWEFNAMGGLHFSEGYQIKMLEEVSDFQFCEAIVPEDGVSQADVDAAYVYGASSVDITSDNEDVATIAYAEGAASVTPEDGISQADVDAAFDEGAASVTPEDGIGQSDVDSAYAYGAASVDITLDNQTAFDEGAASVNPEDGVSQSDLDALAESYAGYTAPLDLQIGDQHAGGIVFQINENGSGLVAAMEDLDGLYEWGQAVTQASNYTSGGYSGWHLPSLDELVEMYNTIGNGGQEGNIGGFEDDWYWSSSETNGSNAWTVFFSDGHSYYFNKFNSYRVRVIRAF